MNNGVLFSVLHAPDIGAYADARVLADVQQEVGSQVPSEEILFHLTAHAVRGEDSSGEYRRLLRDIALGSYGSEWLDVLEGSAKRGDPAAIYMCWLLTGQTRLAVAIAEAGSIPNFARHVNVRECLESGRTDHVMELGGEAIPPLINAALMLDDPLGSRAYLILRNLSAAPAINRLCEIWFETRNAALADIITSCGYTAEKPANIRIATALLNNDLATASSVGAADVPTLVGFLSDSDAYIRDAAVRSLLLLKDHRAVNALLTIWSCQRTSDLDNIVANAGFVATDPPYVKVLSALRNERYDALDERPEFLVQPLLAALSDEDSRIADRAAGFLPSLLGDEGACELLCTLAMRRAEPRAMAIAMRHGLHPKNMMDRALFFFLTEQWGEYEACDFDLSILRQWFEHGGSDLRLRIADAARRAGRLELVELVSGARRRRRMWEMTEREWRVALSILREQQNWDKMWRMAVTAPAVWAVEALEELNERGWRPTGVSHQADFAKLAAYARRCGAEPPTIGMEHRPVYKFTAHTRRMSALVVSSYFHRTLATSSWDGTVNVWDMRDGELTTSMKAYAHPVSSIAATPDGSRLFAASGAHPSVIGWAMPEGQPAFSMGGHQKGVACLAASPDGRVLAAGGFDDAVYLWRLGDQRLMGILRSHGASVRSLAFSPDGDLLASGSEDGEVRLWDMESQRLLRVVPAHTLTVRCISFSPDGASFFTCSSDNDVAVWDVSQGQLRWKLPGHHNVVSSVAASGDGRVIASAGWDQQILLWEAATGACLGSLRGHLGHVTCLATDVESRALVSGGNDAQVCVWNFQSGIFRRATKRDEMETVEAMLKDCQDEAARPWLEFLLAQMRQRWKFDIQIADDQPFIEIGEFDIEIAE